MVQRVSRKRDEEDGWHEGLGDELEFVPGPVDDVTKDDMLARIAKVWSEEDAAARPTQMSHPQMEVHTLPSLVTLRSEEEELQKQPLVDLEDEAELRKKWRVAQTRHD